MEIYIVERRKGISFTEDANCFISDSLEKCEKWIKENGDFENRETHWWWVVIKGELNSDVFYLYKIYDWDANELEEQPIQYNL